MSCCDAVTAPRLAYAVVSESPTCFDNPDAIVQKVGEAGFCVLTLVPEHPVWAKVGTPPIADPGNPGSARNIPEIELIPPQDPSTHAANPHYRFTPSVAKTKALIQAAIRKGLCVQIVPHIDALGLMTDPPAGRREGSYGAAWGNKMPWRGFFWFDPIASGYRDQIILPLVLAAAEAIQSTRVEGSPDCKPCVSFVLGAEVDMSLAGCGAHWSQLLRDARAARDAILTNADDQKRLEFGHKVNHNFASSIDTWLDLWARWHGGASPDKSTAKTAAGSYLAALDFLSFSYYPNLGPRADWDSVLDAAQVRERAERMQRAFVAMKNDVLGLMPPLQAGDKRPCIEIGEAGIGWLNTAEPNADVPTGVDGKIDCDAIEANDSALLKRYRRIKFNYFIALLRFMQDQAALFDASNCKSACHKDFRTVALWTNHWQFDLLGLNLPKQTAEMQVRLRRKFIDSDLDQAVLRIIKAYARLIRGEAVDLRALIEELRMLGVDRNTDGSRNPGCGSLLPFVFAPLRFLILGSERDMRSAVTSLGMARSVFPVVPVVATEERRDD